MTSGTSGADKPRSGERIQPTAEAVGDATRRLLSPGGETRILAVLAVPSLGAGEVSRSDFLSPLSELGFPSPFISHGLRRGLHSFAASRLETASFPSSGAPFRGKIVSF